MPVHAKTKLSQAFISFQKQNISTHFKNVNLRDVLRILAQYDHRNIVLHSAVNGAVTLYLDHASSAETFDFLLKINNLKSWKTGSIWYVAPIDHLIKQEQEEFRWRNVLEEAAPIVTAIWQLHYAKVDDLAHWLQDDRHAWLSKHGRLHIDTRTNMLCIQDTQDRLTAMYRLIKKLDVPVKQVLIQARLASIDSDYEQELGLRYLTNNMNNTEDNKKGLLANGSQFSLAIARLVDSSLLDIKLTALENEGHGELISNPSLFTASHQTASIEAGEEIPYQEASSSGATAVVFKKAVLSLKVTPQILPGRKILLQLQINQDRPSSRTVLGVPAISTRQIITNVLLPNGHTVVLGGIYESSRENNIEGVPFLSKIPLLGWLFQTTRQRHAKRELLIFVTPRIVE